MIEFTATDARRARDEILSNDTLFADRIFPEGYYDKNGLHEHIKSVLELLFERKKIKGKKWSNVWVTVDEVIEAIKYKHVANKHPNHLSNDSLKTQATLNDVKNLFYDLDARGGFNKKNNSIRISAPLLADWIQNSHII